MTTAPPDTRSDAVLSEDGLYRYRLRRSWAPPEAETRAVVWVMLNPSTADANIDDATISKCKAFARTWGRDGIIVVNLFAWRATDPRDLVAADLAGKPIRGPENDRYLAETFDLAREREWPVIAAWGAHKLAGPRGRVVARRAERDHGVTLQALKVTASGAPGHPLYLPGASEPFPWQSDR